MQNNDLRSILQPLIFHWQQSSKAYADYMSNGKKFRYAEVLKQHNTAAKKLLADNLAIIPDHLKQDAKAVIEHYTIWTDKWDELNRRLNPGPDDEFVFENEHRFPKDSANKLEAAFADVSR